ncbi:lipid-A-disaccharide synthase [Dokdonella sp.]|uniref:lipid-A-disaccharide synthase n=1 Tax=Dokdonella sp. TaxID=2291710 RepID=UPI003C6F1E3F
MRDRFPDARFAGIGGPRMIAAGLDAWFPAERLAVMGLAEVLRHLPGLLWIRRAVRKRAVALRPDAFIGIDAPDFNLGLERKLKRAGIRTLHYVSPSIWAWRENRAQKIGQCVDRVLCLFPMEPPVYARHNVDARFVGHPLANAFDLEPDQNAARTRLGLPANVPVLALLPGSRLGEIKRLGADFIAAAQILAKEIPNLHVVAPMANEVCGRAFANALAKAGVGNGEWGVEGRKGDDAPALTIPDSPFSILILNGQSHTAMVAADAILLASGTAALEALLAKRPMVVAYRLAALTHRIVKGLGLLKVERYSLPNHLSGRDLVPELMQDQCTPPALADALRDSLRTRSVSPDLLVEYKRIHESLRGDARHSAATAIID